MSNMLHTGIHGEGRLSAHSCPSV